MQSNNTKKIFIYMVLFHSYKLSLPYIKTITRKMHVKPIKMRWASGGVNYAYLLSNQERTKSWLIDPAETDEVQDALTSEELNTVEIIANTHHHYDHSDGNLKMVKLLSSATSKGTKNIDVIAGSTASPGATVIPRHLEKIFLDSDIEILCIRTPCHTQDSICYYAIDKQNDDQAIFTGDTLFTAGCGRFFEGDGSEMNIALNHTLLDNTGNESNWAKVKVYPGHEYTKDNVKFIRKYIYTKLGQNEALDRLADFCDQHEVTTGHFTLFDETKFNPFMRLDDPIVRKAVNDPDKIKNHAEVMSILREMKNRG